ncbi:MAG: DUF948 domain-containing protein [Streptosporangiales bacterium]|nr:DUF948 domain-containing protein [Streptosporangiales bacterium]
MLTGGQLAALIVAVFWAILVCFLAYVLVRVARLLTETTKIVEELGERTGPLLDDVSATVAAANTQLVRMDAITANAVTTSENVSRISSLVRSVADGPLVKAASLTYGVRKALAARIPGSGSGSDSGPAVLRPRRGGRRIGRKARRTEAQR